MNEKFMTVGEILMKLSPPNYEKIVKATNYDSNYGGAELNVAIALSNLGIDSSFFTVVPNNPIGESALRLLRENNVSVDDCIIDGERLGLYFMETGFGVRSSEVYYDRKHSAFSEYDYSKIDYEKLLSDCSWLHLSGITPALSNSCQKLVSNLLKTAKELNKTTSFDGNYRSTLWSLEQARDVLTSYLPYIDVLIGIEPYHLLNKNNEDIKEKISMQPTLEEQKIIFDEFASKYNFKAIGRHVRYTHSANENSLKAYLWKDGKTYESNLIRFDILDRVGGGDAFSSGLIYALMKNMPPKDIIDFAVASSVLKHTIHGDFSTIDNPNEIVKIMKKNYEIKR